MRILRKNNPFRMAFAATVARANAWTSPFDAWILRHRTALSRILLAANLVPLALVPFAQFQKDLGSMAWNLLVVLLFLAPVAKVTGVRLLAVLLGFRKELGILMGTLAVAHSVGYFIVPGVYLPNNAAFWADNGVPAFTAWGLAALVVTVPLWLTSSIPAQRLLGKKWKWLHRSAYLLLVLAALHVAFIKYDFVEAAVWVGAYAALKIAEWSGVRLGK